MRAIAQDAHAIMPTEKTVRLTTVVAAGSALDIGASWAGHVDGLALATVVRDVELNLLLLLEGAEALTATQSKRAVQRAVKHLLGG